MSVEDHDVPYPGIRWPEEYFNIVSGTQQPSGEYLLDSKETLYLTWLTQRIGLDKSAKIEQF
jgi:hypothetical protein